MRKAYLSGLAFVALSATAASAADMAVKAPVYKAPAPVVDLWTGFYLGSSVGYGAGGWNSSSNQRVFNFETTSANPNVRGVTFGIQAGYNWRFAPQWIIGIEVEVVDPLKAGQVWNDPGLTECSDCIPEDFVPRFGGPASLSHEWKLRWFSTAAGPRRIHADRELDVLCHRRPGDRRKLLPVHLLAARRRRLPGADVLRAHHPSDEHRFCGRRRRRDQDRTNWSVKFEYLYLDLGKTTVDTLDIDNFPFHVEYRLRSHFARIGINYLFR